MICLLTSAAVVPGTEQLNPANGFVDELRRVLPKPCRALFVCSDPEGHEKTDFYAAVTRASLEEAGFRFRAFRCLDGRTEEQAAALVRGSELLILSGGHVPTQNRFFRRIGLRALLRDHPGVAVGISAGSMNAAELVYAQPEREGEAVDPAYQRFLPGLGLTKTMLLPHLQEVREDVLDGLRLFEDISFADSFGRRFYAIPDGSWLLAENGREELRGEAWLIRDGAMTQIAREGDILRL